MLIFTNKDGSRTMIQTDRIGAGFMPREGYMEVQQAQYNELIAMYPEEELRRDSRGVWDNSRGVLIAYTDTGRYFIRDEVADVTGK